MLEAKDFTLRLTGSESRVEKVKGARGLKAPIRSKNTYERRN